MALWKRTSRSLYDSERILFLPLDSIRPNPDQPRKTFSQPELEELAASIRSLGILQPLTVCRKGDAWELVAGERRLRAARMAGLQEAPCISIRGDAQSTSFLSLVENLQRQDLDFWEEAMGLRRLIDTFGLSQEETARQLGRSQSSVANKLRLLKLSPEALRVLRDGGCTERHARALLRIPEAQQQEELAGRAVSGHLTVAQLELLVENALKDPPPQKPHRLYIIKDVRIFLNTITRAMDIMRSAGVNAQCSREDGEKDILLTIRIPRHPEEEGTPCLPAPIPAPMPT